MNVSIRAKPTAISGHLSALRRRHRDIDGRVDAESRRVHPNGTLLQQLKRERLRMRDEIARYESLQQKRFHGATPA